MRRVAILLMFGMSACSQQPAQRSEQGKAAAAAAPAATAPQSKIYPSKAAAQAAVLPVPADKEQLKRLLLMGYVVHEDHLHPPGMKECPFSMGGSVIQ